MAPRRHRGALAAGLLATTMLGGAAVPVAAVEGTTAGPCLVQASKPGGSGTTARAKARVWCSTVTTIQIQVRLWEQDAGKDQLLSATGWVASPPIRVNPTLFTGPLTACDTENGKEELYATARIRWRSKPSAAWKTSKWHTSAIRKDMTCA